MTFKELRKASGMNQRQFAEYFNIPLRTIENWEADSEKCKQYLLDLMRYKLQNEASITHCKDCIYWGSGFSLETEKLKCCECERGMTNMDDFCSHGETSEAFNLRMKLGIFR